MHDETFLVTQGKMRFHLLNGKTIDAAQGDYVTVPTRSPHTFSNPYDEEAKFFNTYTPAHYINYFKLLATMSEKGTPMNPESNRKAMAVSHSVAQNTKDHADHNSISPQLVLLSMRCKVMESRVGQQSC